MYIEEVTEEEEVKRWEEEENQLNVDRSCSENVVVSDAKRVLVGAGARALFYPTLLYNVIRSKIQSEFRWWDRVDEFVVLGAVPFPADVPRLRELGVSGVVTLNESYETLVPASLYLAHNIDHLVIPTRDYCFAPSFADICQAVEFIHENASAGKTTYVHCKAGRGRSTTIVLCYLVAHRQMTPETAYEYVRSIRPRVQLATSQRRAVQDYYLLKMSKTGSSSYLTVGKSIPPLAEQDTVFFDDGSVVIVTELDIDGYEDNRNSDEARSENSPELSLASRIQFASQAAVSRVSCLWLRYHADRKTSSMKKLGSSVSTNPLENLGVDIQVH